MSAADAAIQKKIKESRMTALIIWNEGVEDIMKIVRSLEEFRLFIKGVSKTIKNEAKEKKEDFFQCY